MLRKNHRTQFFIFVKAPQIQSIQLFVFNFGDKDKIIRIPCPNPSTHRHNRTTRGGKCAHITCHFLRLWCAPLSEQGDNNHQRNGGFKNGKADIKLRKTSSLHHHQFRAGS
ncbi:Uncharacterised protein [Vibrio cholerae]|uniref:Uncharacterized protein n=1 Tax=Vibrio cholerae TaxID=666 RepID=A0A656AHA0_VIBCL|nr:Uncharacterised protein [Vibrio cholerae]CSD10480.1 Uncharacterised protein [Vibrio cholerae]